MKNENPIEEIWRIRDEIGAEHGYEVDKLFDSMRKLEKQYGDRLVRTMSRHAPEEASGILREKPPKAE